MPTNGDLLLFDTSAALAYVDAASPLHHQVRRAAEGAARGLSGHAVFEFLSVTTRLPPPMRISAADAALLVRREFPESRFLPVAQSGALIAEFARRSIAGGMIYDGLVAACSRHHELTLLSCDRRAEDTYRLLGAPYRLIASDA